MQATKIGHARRSHAQCHQKAVALDQQRALPLARGSRGRRDAAARRPNTTTSNSPHTGVRRAGSLGRGLLQPWSQSCGLLSMTTDQLPQAASVAWRAAIQS